VTVGGVQVKKTKAATPPAPTQVFKPKKSSGKKAAVKKAKQFPFAQKSAKGTKARFTG